MKHPHSIIINNIVQQFNQVGMIIEADKQVLLFFTLNGMVKKFERKRQPDIIFGNPMLKRRPTECDDDCHTFILIRPQPNVKLPALSPGSLASPLATGLLRLRSQ
jgi:hypothetical protein